MKYKRKYERLHRVALGLVLTGLLAIPHNTSANTVLWEQVDLSHPIFAGLFAADDHVMMLTQGFRLMRVDGKEPVYLMRNGWEEGWDFVYKSGDDWISVTEYGFLTPDHAVTEVVFYEEFEFGDFDQDGDRDLLLYESYTEAFDTPYMPASPRFFLMEDELFAARPLACSPVLHAFYTARMERFTTARDNGAFAGQNMGLLDAATSVEAKLLDQPCDAGAE